MTKALETWRSSSENAPGGFAGEWCTTLPRGIAARLGAKRFRRCPVASRPAGTTATSPTITVTAPRERGTCARANVEGSSGEAPPRRAGIRFPVALRGGAARGPSLGELVASSPRSGVAHRDTSAGTRSSAANFSSLVSACVVANSAPSVSREETSRARRFSRAPFARLRRVFSAAGEVTSSPFRSRLVPPPTTNPNGAARAVELDFSPRGGPSHPPRLPEDAAGFDFSQAAEGPPDPGSAAPAPASRFAVPPPPFFFGTPPPRASLFAGGRSRPRPSPTIAEETSTISRAGTRTVVVSGVFARASAEVQSSSPSSARLNLGLV